jgi:hypothetical protein
MVAEREGDSRDDPRLGGRVDVGRMGSGVVARQRTARARVLGSIRAIALAAMNGALPLGVLMGTTAQGQRELP